MDNAIKKPYIKLINQWNSIEDIWNDKISNYFFHTFISPLGSDINKAQTILDELIKVLKDSEINIK